MSSITLPNDDEPLHLLACLVKRAGYRFTTVTPATHERVNSRPGNEWGHSLEDVFGWSRPFQADVLHKTLFKVMQEAQAAAPHGDGWRSQVRLSTLSGQLFLHSAYPTTSADAVFFGPDTYRYAIAMEQYAAASQKAPQRIVDIGCGAGPGAILSALTYPDAQVYGVDINDAALRLARINALLADVPAVEFLNSNLLSNVEGSFDLIVANPPYLIDPSERAYRHGGGLLGAELSLAIVDTALKRLESGGTLLLYTGSAIVTGKDHFYAALQKRLKKAKVEWQYREMDPDIFGEELETLAYSNADRIAAVVATITKK